MKIDDVPEYQAMRRGLMALRLEVDQSIANDLLSLCEKAIIAVRDEAYVEGVEFALTMDHHIKMNEGELSEAPIG